MDSRRRRAARLWAGFASVSFALVFLLQYGPQMQAPWLADGLALDFSKTPLQAGALLWYLAAVHVVLAWSHLLWSHLEGGAVARALALLGRHSLLVYTAHVFTEVPVLEVVWGRWPSAVARCALALADVAALGALAVLADGGLARWLGERMRGLGRALADHPLRWTAAPIGAAALVLLSFSVREPQPDQTLMPLPLEGEVFVSEAELAPAEMELVEPLLLTCEEGEHCTLDGYVGPWDDEPESPALDGEIPADVAAEI